MKINRHIYWTPLIGLIYIFLVGLIYGFDTKLENLSETEEFV